MFFFRKAMRLRKTNVIGPNRSSLALASQADPSLIVELWWFFISDNFTDLVLEAQIHFQFHYLEEYTVAFFVLIHLTDSLSVEFLF